MKKAHHFGYEGQKPEALHQAVTELGALLIDIRYRPFSRNAVWNKKNLQELFGDNYLHLEAWGNINYRGGPIEIADFDKGLKVVLHELENRPVVLMCVCREFERCHRSVLADKLHRQGVEVERLLPSPILSGLTSPLTRTIKKQKMPKPIEALDNTTQQLSLIELEIDKASVADTNGSSAFKDPAFASNKTKAVHRWVPWIAGFAHDFVHGSIDKYLGSEGVVLDPFAGVGTTLVEAVLLGHDTIGFEINPYAALACRTKATAYKLNSRVLQHEIARLDDFYVKSEASGYEPKSTPPSDFKTRADFYSPKVLRKVLIIQDFLDTIRDKKVRDMFSLAFASTMVSYSNYSYEPSLGRRVCAGKEEIEDFPVGETISKKLSEMAEDVLHLQSKLKDKEVNAKVINDSFFLYKKYLTPNSIDLVVTSPPYLNNYHYNRNTRPHLYWLGYAKSPKDFKEIEHANFGKYWQTVRDQKLLTLDFKVPDIDLEERLALLRGLNAEKGNYGGNGWANYAASYFNDCHKFALGLNYVLKSGGTALVVIGNSILQGVLIPTDQYFGKIAESVGLELVDIHIPRATRIGNSIIQSEVRVAKAHASHQLYEAVVELRKR